MFSNSDQGLTDAEQRLSDAKNAGEAADAANDAAGSLTDTVESLTDTLAQVESGVDDYLASTPNVPPIETPKQETTKVETQEPVEIPDDDERIDREITRVTDINNP